MAIFTRRFRHPALRAALLALAAAFAGAGAADASGWHECPHHDRVPDQHSHGQAVPAPAGEVDAHDGSHGGDADADGHGPCTCTGGACSAAATALPSPSDADLRRTAAILRKPILPLPEVRRIVREAYLHPFANAPPTV